jgi:pyruvate/2-oxoglutarate dehydrogenase complex dihydrolipoamide acyltransferase (E2) component
MPLMAGQRVELRMPDLELGGIPMSACVWHAAVGDRVVEGDLLLEVLAGEVTVDLSAPASGVLVERSVEIDDRLHTGQMLAAIEVSS